MEYKLTDKIKERICTDNQFSLDLSKVLDKRQDYIIKQAKVEETRHILILYPSIEFYISQGYKLDDIFENYANTEAESV